VAAAEATLSLSQSFGQNALKTRLLTRAEAVLVVAIAVAVGEVGRIPPYAVAKHGHHQRALAADRIQNTVDNRPRFAINGPQRAERAVHHHRVAIGDTKRAELVGDLTTC